MDQSQLFALSEFIDNLSSHVRQEPPNLFRSKVLRSLSEKIEFDGAIWGDAHIEDGMTLYEPEIQFLDLEELSDVQAAAYSDPHLLMVLNQPGIPVAYSVKASAPNPLKAFAHKHNVGHIMSTAHFETELGLASGIVLTRKFSTGSFGGDEVALMTAIFKHLMKAWQDNQIQFGIKSFNKNKPNIQFASVGRNQKISAAEDGFLALIKLEWLNFRGPNLPDAIQALLVEGLGAKYIGQRIVVKLFRAPQTELLLARKRMPADNLTPKQMAVAKLCSIGYSYKEIADHLSIAPTTARNHLAAIHNRLGVVRNSEIGGFLDEMN